MIDPYRGFFNANMKKTLLITILLIFNYNFNCQSTFNIIHGQNNDLESYRDIIDVGDGLVVLLRDDNIDFDDDEFSIARVNLKKLDYQGQILLENIDYEYDSLFNLTSGVDLMKKTFDNGFIRGGTIRKRDTTLTTNYISISSKAIISKYDENLEKEWMTIVGENWEDTSTQYIGNDVWQMPDSSYYLVGSRLKNSNIESMLIKVSSMGELEWVHYIDTLNNHENAHRIIVKDEYIYITVKETNTLGGPTINRIFMKLNLNGDVIDVVITSEPDQVHTSEGIVLLSDNTIGTVSILDDFTFRINKYDLNLETIWADDFVLDSTTWNTYRYLGIEEDLDGNIITVGTSFTYNNEIGQFGFFRKYSPDGNVIWTRRYRHVEEEMATQELYDVTATSDGGYAACGMVAASWVGIHQDGWVIKVDSMGCLVPGCDSLDTSSNEINDFKNNPSWFAVGPNPVSKNGMLNVYCKGNTNNQYQLRNPVFVLFDTNGNKIKEFDLEKISLTYIINFQKIASGNYLLSLLDGNKIIQNEKIIVLK